MSPFYLYSLYARKEECCVDALSCEYALITTWSFKLLFLSISKTYMLLILTLLNCKQLMIKLHLIDYIGMMIICLKKAYFVHLIIH